MTLAQPLQALFLSNDLPGMIKMHEQGYRDDIAKMTVPQLECSRG
jgi:hypothetical protein